jgi:polyisoprenoid-binding protein YceI
MIRPLLVAALALPLAAAPGALLADWSLDQPHSQVFFTVNHLGFADVTGTFREFDATVAFDPDDIEATEVTLTIDAASIDTLWEARDDHIRSEDFLDVANHPEITFVSTGLTLIDDATAELAGDLTIRGETRPVALEATLNNIGPNPFNPDQEIAGFTITGEVDRTEFGIDFGAPVIGAVLPVTVNVELTRTN